jgi:23S rRNA (uridine2552-2'-O)-methyltransferase
MASYRRADKFTQAARRLGYPARSVFKLQSLQRRFHLFKRGQSIVDLGAAPGSWSLFASKAVGGAGHVLALDIKERLMPLPGAALPSNVRYLRQDVFRWKPTVNA